MISYTKRYLMHKDELLKFQAIPIYKIDEKVNQKNGSSGKIVSGIPAAAEDDATRSIIGLSIHGWQITSSNSCIANQDEVNGLTATLTSYAKQKLWPPEILFYHAHVTIARVHNNSNNTVSISSKSALEAPSLSAAAQSSSDTILKLDATSALSEWATAHSNKEDSGVLSILKSVDAPLWEARQKKQMMMMMILQQQQHQQHPATAKTMQVTSSSSAFSQSRIGEFNFDWTYSTAFTGYFQTESKREEWIPCDKSGIQMDMLTDRTQPILFFDDVTLYEDDLHDNGQVQLSIKIRVMPKCFYLLQRLFLRVDRVILRCRDTRIFHPFISTSTSSSPVVVYRDVTWREAKWEELSGLHLPSDVPSWRISDDSNSSQILLNKLPLAKLPSGLVPHSCVQLD